MNKEKNFASAVIYIHNAEKSVCEFVRTVAQILDNNFEHTEIICVNDFSTDKSREIIKKLVGSFRSKITLLNMSYFHGVETAMCAGVELAIGDFVFEFDSTNLDFSPEVIMQVYNKALEGYDVVSASADVPEKFSSKIFYCVFNHFAHLHYEMTSENFRVLSRRVINRINAMNKSTFYRKAVYANCGLDTFNIKYKLQNNSSNSATISNNSYRLRLAIDSLLLFTDIGYKFSITMTTIMMSISIFMSIYSLLFYSLSYPVAGWTTTILFLSVAFFGLFGILTIIIKYLQLLLGLTFRKKNFSFQSIEKLSN